MNLIYYAIKFVGYTTPANGVKYARLEQRVECASDTSQEDLVLMGFSAESKMVRELFYQVPEHHQDFETLLERYASAKIIRTISHEPICTSTEHAMLSRGLVDLTKIIERQIVRFKNSVYLDLAGLPVYAQNKLSLTGELNDQDLRPSPCAAELEYGEAEPIIAFTY